MKYQILNGDNRLVLKTLESNSIDSIITDPPYGIDFLGKAWDANTGALETYQECLRVLKPGGHILAFSAPRTYHHLAVTLEQAGFEIRDQIMWIYSSGFPKSQDVGRTIQRGLGVKEKKTIKALNGYAKEQTSNGAQRVGDVTKDDYEKEITSTIVTDLEAKQWEGWGTALKPAHEPICLARKPSKLSIAQNVQRWGTGAVNIDATRIPWAEDDNPEAYVEWMKKYPTSTGSKSVFNNAHADAKGVEYIQDKDSEINANRNVDNRMAGRFPSNVIGEITEPYQKYFYCPKVSRAERHMGFELPPPMFGNVQGCYGPDGERFAVGFDDRATGKILHIGSTHPDDIKKHPLWDPSIGGDAQRLKKKILEHTPDSHKGNHHPTVKPVELMKYLIKLVTPPNGKVLDPFNGSGSTGMAAVELGYEYIGIEQDEKYCEISRKRIEAHFKKSDPLRASGLFD